MRIRTIKPEFWSHPVMARQSDETKLLAIGLLNYADDEGYFFAEPAMVRASLRPLDEDSTIVRRSFERLSEIGYLETIQHHTHGLLGRVVSFSNHQRVDRANKSKIKALWEVSPIDERSTNNRRTIVEQSPLEGKGREQGTGKEISEAFETFWKVWPKKKAREDARKAFSKVKVPVEDLLKAVEASISTPDWQKDGGKYIPHAATWLNGKRWQDETTTSASAPTRQMTADDRAEQERRKAACDKAAWEQAEELQRMLEKANRPPCAPGELEEIFEE